MDRLSHPGEVVQIPLEEDAEEHIVEEQVPSEVAAS